jgi:diaminohydroxyphosphoribosylaminopyrimidine deaminase/5-amino-6-(5-phosphoribosylamino)uracil reductase
MYNQNDIEHMNAALAQAKKSLFISNPNPRVGCVLVKDGQIIGCGFTQAVGGDHAEIMALKDAEHKGYDVSDSSAYVTLEPCCHQGRTPPCTDSLIKAKIKTIFVAMQDPNPHVAGKGLELLRQAGIEVRCGLLEKEANELNLGFIKRMSQGLPWVRLKIASSLDGKTALNNGTSQWITGTDARLDGHHWRAQACCILTGIGTVKEDNPQLNARGVNTSRQPLRVLIDSFLEVSLDAEILDQSIGGHTIVICGNVDSAHFEKTKKILSDKNVTVLQLSDHSPGSKGKVDLPAVFKYLADKLHINEVQVEAGFKLNGSLIRESCVDELLIYMAPRLIGDGLGIANLPELQSLDKTIDWTLVDHTSIGNDLRLRLFKTLSENKSA